MALTSLRPTGRSRRAVVSTPSHHAAAWSPAPLASASKATSTDGATGRPSRHRRHQVARHLLDGEGVDLPFHQHDRLGRRQAVGIVEGGGEARRPHVLGLPGGSL